MGIELFLYSFPAILFLAIFIYILGGRRGLYSLLGHLVVIWLIPVILDDLLSVFFISTPLLAIYYFVMYRIAEILIPFANPDDKEETKKHFWVLFWYSWGLQYPIWVVADHTGQKVEERIPGKFTRKYGVGVPGIILARSHHAVGITGGFQFSRVAGPGIVFTNRFERPNKIIDLRTQIRSSEVEAISKDGVLFKAILVIIFSVDKENWTQELYVNLTMENPMLKGGKNTDHTAGSYPFSSRRVRTVILLSSASDSSSTETDWDFWVMGQVESIAQRVLAQRKLNDLWIPRNPNDGSSAITEISEEIFNKAQFPLLRQGVRLYAARIVNFEFVKSEKSKDDNITEQQLETWSTHWAERAFQSLITAETQAILETEKVRSEIKSAQLAMFEEITKQPHKDKDFGRKLSVLLYINSLSEFVKPDNKPSEADTDKSDNEIHAKVSKQISDMFPNMYIQLKNLLLKEKNG